MIYRALTLNNESIKLRKQFRKAHDTIRFCHTNNSVHSTLSHAHFITNNVKNQHCSRWHFQHQARVLLQCPEPSLGGAVTSQEPQAKAEAHMMCWFQICCAFVK